MPDLNRGRLRKEIYWWEKERAANLEWRLDRVYAEEQAKWKPILHIYTALWACYRSDEGHRVDGHCSQVGQITIASSRSWKRSQLESQIEFWPVYLGGKKWKYWKKSVAEDSHKHVRRVNVLQISDEGAAAHLQNHKASRRRVDRVYAHRHPRFVGGPHPWLVCTPPKQPSASSISNEQPSLVFSVVWRVLWMHAKHWQCDRGGQGQLHRKSNEIQQHLQLLCLYGQSDIWTNGKC